MQLTYIFPLILSEGDFPIGVTKDYAILNSKSIIRASTLHKENFKFLCRKSFNVVREDCF